jgi:predicted negative regulator of RcsB-dependent stress response
MGLLGKIFGSKVTKKPSGELLKEATQLKKAGDWDGAIKALRQAYANAKSEGVSYGADAYLRLPKYLYEAGKSDEAWSECVFQTKVATDSRRSLPPIPRESCH